MLRSVLALAFLGLASPIPVAPPRATPLARTVPGGLHVGCDGVLANLPATPNLRLKVATLGNAGDPHPMTVTEGLVFADGGNAYVFTHGARVVQAAITDDAGHTLTRQEVTC